MQRETPADNITHQCCAFFVSSGLRYDVRMAHHSLITFHHPPRAHRGHPPLGKPPDQNQSNLLWRGLAASVHDLPNNPALDLDHALAPHRGADDFELLHVITKAATAACHAPWFPVGLSELVGVTVDRNGSASLSAVSILATEPRKLCNSAHRLAGC